MDEMIKAMIDALKKCNGGMVSVKLGKYTFIITDDENGGEYLVSAWDEYCESA